MRHGNKNNALSRKKAHRDALLSNMACSLFEHKRITTTLAKARALRIYAEPLITKSKTDSTHSRRVVFSQLQNKEAVAGLFRDVAPKVAERPGGYLRIIKLGTRPGDASEMAMIELVDFNEAYSREKSGAAAKKTRRTRRRSGAKAAGEEAATESAPEAKAEESKSAGADEAATGDGDEAAKAE